MSKKAFSNALVKAKSSPSNTPETYNIASPTGQGRAVDVGTSLLSRLLGQSPASATVAASFQSPPPGRGLASTGSPGSHAGAPGPLGLPHGSGAGRSNRLAPAVPPSSPLPTVDRLDIEVVQGLRDVMEVMRSVAIKDQERLYALECDQDDVQERLRKLKMGMSEHYLFIKDYKTHDVLERLRHLEAGLSELTLSLKDHKTNAPDTFDIKRLDEKIDLLNVARREHTTRLDEDVDAIKSVIENANGTKGGENVTEVNAHEPSLQKEGPWQIVTSS